MGEGGRRGGGGGQAGRGGGVGGGGEGWRRGGGEGHQTGRLGGARSPSQAPFSPNFFGTLDNSDGVYLAKKWQVTTAMIMRSPS